MTSTDTTLDPHIRWLIRRDVDEVLAIEKRSFMKPWTEEDFLTALKQRNVIGCVYDTDHSRVDGFVIYELHKTRLHILNFAVDPQSRRTGVGSAMVDRLKGKLSQQRRAELTAIVSERNIQAQLFFQKHGFIARGILPDHFDGGIDGYEMIYREGWS